MLRFLSMCLFVNGDRIKENARFFSPVARTLIFPFCVSIGSYFFDFMSVGSRSCEIEKMTANGFLQRSRGLCPNAPGELKGYSTFMKHFKYRRLMTLPATAALGFVIPDCWVRTHGFPNRGH